MSNIGKLCVATVVLLLLGSGCADAQARQGPEGLRFYDPPARLVPGPPGSVIWSRPAEGLIRFPQASRNILVLYRSRALDGDPIAVSGSLHIPSGSPPAGGWPIVSWGHVTTGSADSCAPTRATPESPELERMLRGNAITEELLQAGVAVVRSDYEGLGAPGPHPYLSGRSEARSLIDIVRAARRIDREIGSAWAAAGHSEGGQAALFAAAIARRWAPELELRAAAAIAPPSHIEELIELAGLVPVAGPGIADLSALGGLILEGAAVAEPSLWPLYRAGALSDEALALMPDIRRLCLAELAGADSWGGLAPADIAGPNAEAAKPALYSVLDRNDPGNVAIRGVPIRLDQGMLDLVVPSVFTDQVVEAHRGRGTDVTYRRYPTADHRSIPSRQYAARPVSAWLARALGVPGGG